MHTVYTIILAFSASLLVLASCSALRHVYPSLRLMFPDSPEQAPYGIALSAMTIGFFLVTYIPASTFLASLGALIFAGYAMLRPLPFAAHVAAGIVVALTAILHIATRMSALDSIAPERLALVAMIMALPLVAVFATRSEAGARMALYGTVAGMLALIVISMAMSGGKLLLGATDAVMLLVPVVAALYYHHTRKPGAFGLAGVMPMMVAAGFACDATAEASAPIAGLVAAAILLLGLVVAALIPASTTER